MAQVSVSKFTVFDVTGQKDIPSSRDATNATISIIGGTPIAGTEIKVEETELDDMGMTMPGFVQKT